MKRRNKAGERNPASNTTTRPAMHLVRRYDNPALAYAIGCLQIDGRGRIYLTLEGQRKAVTVAHALEWMRRTTREHWDRDFTHDNVGEVLFWEVLLRTVRARASCDVLDVLTANGLPLAERLNIEGAARLAGVTPAQIIIETVGQSDSLMSWTNGDNLGQLVPGTVGA